METNITSPRPHYLYGRVRVPGGGFGKAKFLQNEGRVGRIDAETGDVELVISVYALDEAEAKQLALLAQDVGLQFQAMADDLKEYIKCHDFSKPGGVSQPECEKEVRA